MNIEKYIIKATLKAASEAQKHGLDKQAVDIKRKVEQGVEDFGGAALGLIGDAAVRADALHERIKESDVEARLNGLVDEMKSRVELVKESDAEAKKEKFVSIVKEMKTHAESVFGLDVPEDAAFTRETTGDGEPIYKDGDLKVFWRDGEKRIVLLTHLVEGSMVTHSIRATKQESFDDFLARTEGVGDRDALNARLADDLRQYEAQREQDEEQRLTIPSGPVFGYAPGNPEDYLFDENGKRRTMTELYAHLVELSKKNEDVKIFTDADVLDDCPAECFEGLDDLDDAAGVHQPFVDTARAAMKPEDMVVGEPGRGNSVPEVIVFDEAWTFTTGDRVNMNDVLSATSHRSSKSIGEQARDHFESARSAKDLLPIVELWFANAECDVLVEHLTGIDSPILHDADHIRYAVEDAAWRTEPVDPYTFARLRDFVELMVTDLENLDDVG